MRRDQQCLKGILEVLDWTAKSIAGRTEADSPTVETLCLAVAQKLAIIGKITKPYNSVPWPDVAGLGNILVHPYNRGG